MLFRSEKWPVASGRGVCDFHGHPAFGAPSGLFWPLVQINPIIDMATFEMHADKSLWLPGGAFRSAFLFGAHIFSQYLLSFGLDQSKIHGILDNSTLKIGKRLYGTNLTVFNPKVIANEDVGVILKVGSYRNEIIDQLFSF